MRDAYVPRPEHWPLGTHQFRDHAEFMAAVAEDAERRISAEADWLMTLSREDRIAFMHRIKAKRRPKCYEQLRRRLWARMRNEESTQQGQLL